MATITTVAQNEQEYVSQFMGFERRAFYAYHKTWLFYQNTTDWKYYYRTLDEGSTVWSDPVFVADGSTWEYFTIWFDGTYVHYAFSYQVPLVYDAYLFYRKGKPNADGTISWVADQQTVLESPFSDPDYRGLQGYITLAVDSAGYPWIGYCRDNPLETTITKSSTNDGTWVTASGFPYIPDVSITDYGQAIPVPLAGQKVLVVLFKGYSHPSRPRKPVQSRLWDGGWGALKSGSIDAFLYWSGYESVVAIGSEVYAVYQDATGSGLVSAKWSLSTDSWGSEETIATGLDDWAGPTLTSDPDTKTIGCFYQKGNSICHKMLRKGVWDTEETIFATDSPGLSNALYYYLWNMGSFQEFYNSRPGVCWLSVPIWDEYIRWYDGEVELPSVAVMRHPSHPTHPALVAKAGVCWLQSNCVEEEGGP